MALRVTQHYVSAAAQVAVAVPELRVTQFSIDIARAQCMETISMTTLEVWNTAMVALGQPPIRAIDETTRTVQTIRGVWDGYRKSFLADFTWNGAMLTAQLRRIADVPIERWSYQYALPADCTRVWYLNGRQNSDSLKIWQIASVPQRRVLQTDEITAVIQYTADRDVCHLNTQTSNALALHVAYLLAPTFNKTASETREIQENAAKALKDAKRADSYERSPENIAAEDPITDSFFEGLY